MISIQSKDEHQPKTKSLIEELLEIMPESEINTDSPININITEDVGPQFITFNTPTHQFVFKIIEYKSRAEMGIPPSIKKEHSQLVLNNFTTELGLTVADFFMNVFPINLESNQVVNFTVHKDFIYFRMYRFCFRPTGTVMEKIGPHMTLRLWRMTEYLGEVKKTHSYQKYVKNLNLL